MHAAGRSEHTLSSEDMDVLRGWVDAYNRRDKDALLALSDGALEMRPYLATMIEGSTYQGHEGIHEYFKDADAAWERIQLSLLADFEEVGGRLVGSLEIYGRARASGMEVRVPVTWVAEFRRGKVRRLHAYTSRAEASKTVS